MFLPSVLGQNLIGHQEGQQACNSSSLLRYYAACSKVSHWLPSLKSCWFRHSHTLDQR